MRFLFVLLVTLLIPLQVAMSGDGPKLAVSTSGHSKPVVMADPHPSTTARDGLMNELVEVLGAMVIRGKDGLLRAVSLDDCLLMERIGDTPPRYALTLRNRNVVEGELLTGVEGKTSSGFSRILPEQIGSLSWSRRPKENHRFRGYFEPSRHDFMSIVHVGAAPGRVPFGLELESLWFAFREDEWSRPLYKRVLTVGRPEAWEMEVDLQAIRQVVFDLKTSRLAADIEVVGGRPFLGAEVFSEWARTHDLHQALYVMGLDGPLLYVLPMHSVRALSRSTRFTTPPQKQRGKPRSDVVNVPSRSTESSVTVHSGPRGGEITVVDGNSTRTFSMTDIRPVYQGKEALSGELIEHLQLVVLEGKNRGLTSMTMAHIRSGRRVQNSETMIVVLADGGIVEGRWVSDLLGRTQYGPTLISSASIVELVTMNKGSPHPMDLGWSSGLKLQARGLDGARRDLEKATWLLVPDTKGTGSDVRATSMLTLFGPGWVDRIALLSTLAVSRNPYAHSPGWRVSVHAGPTLFGDLGAVPEFLVREILSQHARWSMWIGGVKGSTAHFVPMNTVESLTIDGKQNPVASDLEAVLEIRGANPRERDIMSPAPIFEEARRPSLLESAAVLYKTMILEEPAGVYTLIPLGAVEELKAIDPERIQIVSGGWDNKTSVTLSGRPLTGITGQTSYGQTRVSAEALEGYRRRIVGNSPKDPWGKVRSLTDLRIKVIDGTTLELDVVFFVDEAWEGNDRVPRYTDRFTLEVNGVDQEKMLDALQEAQLTGAIDDCTDMKAKVRMANQPPQEGTVKFLSRVDRRVEWGSPDRGDLVCGMRHSIVQCVEICRIESVVRRQPESVQSR